tara:strand:+ start:1951 stop:3837 length:1887 start_codon:yes stop_codon:yes gene_type:complete
VASNYEVNIKLNTRTVNKQLNNLEKRISKLNKLAQGGRASRTVNKNEKDRLNGAVKLTRQEQRTLRIKQKQLKVDQQQLKVEKETAAALVQQSRISTPKGKNFGQIGGSIGPALPPKTGGSTGGTATRGGGNRFAAAGQSAIISGAFPLLFGQGPLVGGAGALGGGLGALFGGQMGGFAGGLAATSIATPLQQFAIEAGKLGQALDPATKNVEALTAALGVTGTEFEKQLATLKKLGDEEAAFEVARQKMINLVGSDGVNALTKFGQGMTELGNNFARIMTLMKTSFALFVQNSGIGKVVTQTLERATLLKQAEVQGQNTNSPEGKEIQNLLKTRKLTEQFGGLNPQRREELILNLTNQTKGSGLFGQINDQDVQKAREIVNDLIAKQQTLINTKNAQKEAEKMIETIQKSRVNNLDKEIEMLERSLTMSSEEFEIEKQIADMKEEGVIKDEDEIRKKLRKIQLLKEEAEEAQKVKNLFDNIGQTIETGLVDAIEGAIQGTKTLGEVASSVFGQIQRSLIQFGVNSLLGGFFPGSRFFGGTRAEGGPVKGGKSYLVGERGPEMFNPGVSGTITPNHAMGSATNIVVNVDASGSSVEGDQEQGRELGRLISAAIQSELIEQRRPGGLLR